MTQWLATIAYCLPLLLAAPGVQAAAGEIPPPAPAADYRLTWHDEFAGTELDPAKWKHRFTDTVRGTTTFRADCARLDGDGHLELLTRYGDTQETFEAAMITTHGLFEQKYGYFEARIQFAEPPGAHGAFWLASPTHGKWAEDPGRSGMEIDIIEYFHFPARLSHAVHWGAYRTEEYDKVNQQVEWPRTGQADPTAWHTYGLLWTPEEYIFFIDDIETWRTDAAVSQRSQFILFSNNLTHGDSPSWKTLNIPNTMRVDWVRAWAPPAP